MRFKFLNIFIFCGIIFVFACTNNKEKFTTTPQSLNEEFLFYAKNFEEVSLPLTIKGCEVVSSKYPAFDGNSFGKYAEPNSFAYGKIKTDEKYVALITLMKGDCFFPILTVYTPNGKILDKKILSIDTCENVCGSICQKVFKIDTDYTFYVADTILRFTCDDVGHEIPGTLIYYVNYVTGALLPSGIINMTDKQKKDLNYKPGIEDLKIE